MAHISVLMNEVLEGLALKPTDIVVDGTINGGGHSFEISKQLSHAGILIGIDQDATGLAVSEKKLRDAAPQINLIHDNFKNIDVIIRDLGLESIDKLLLDLGWSSNQFENPDRGFSFMHDGPLLMTLSENPESVPFTAYDIVNDWSQESLMDILEGYGEEKYAWHIVQAIIRARDENPISSTLVLAEIIYNAVPLKYRNTALHPATKTFQALRITVNNEMEVLKQGLEKSFQLLSSGGRMVVISFHSIEDRIVKNFFKDKHYEQKAIIVTKKPITATDEELQENRRSRSAKLRILEKI
jgi:16S rRNA (cytosine1402-N4)-methyltransferase